MGILRSVGENGKPLARVGRKAPGPMGRLSCHRIDSVCGLPGAPQAFSLAEGSATQGVFDIGR